MKTLGPKEGYVYIQMNDSTIGEYVDSNNVRYTLNVGVKVAMPDWVDETAWEEVESVEKYCENHSLTYDPLTEEEIEEIIRKESEARHE